MPNKLNQNQLAKIIADAAVGQHSERATKQLLNHIAALHEEIRVLWVGIHTGNTAFDSVVAQNKQLKQQLKIALRHSGWEPPETQ